MGMIIIPPLFFLFEDSILRWLYSFLFYLALPFVFLRLLIKSKKLPENRQRWAERLGFTPFQLKECIWIHTVSVGETLAAIPLIRRIQQAYSQYPLLITNMTVTGAARAKATFGNSI